METNKREPRVFRDIFWKRFKDTKKSTLLNNIVEATQTENYLLDDFFSQENGIGKLLAEVDNPLSELDPHKLMETIYHHILSKKIVIETRPIEDIFSMIIERERVSPELKERFISELWNTYATDDEHKERFVNLFTQSKLTPELLNRLLRNPQMNGLLEFLNSTSESFEKNYRDVLLKPYFTEHIHEPQRISALVETTILDDLLREDALFSWLTPASLAVLYDSFFTEHAPTERSKIFYLQCINHISALIEQGDIQANKYVIFFVTRMIDDLARFENEPEVVRAIDLLLKNVAMNDKILIVMNSLAQKSTAQQRMFIEFLLKKLHEGLLEPTEAKKLENDPQFINIALNHLDLFEPFEAQLKHLVLNSFQKPPYSFISEFSKQTDSIKSKFRAIVLENIESGIFNTEIKKDILSDIHLLADVLSNPDLSQFQAWCELIVKSQPKMRKMPILFSTIDKCFSILTPEQKTQMVQNFLNTLDSSECLTFLSESPTLFEIALNAPTNPLLTFTSYTDLFKGMITEGSRTYWHTWREISNWGGAIDHRELRGDGTLDKIEITNREKRYNEEIKTKKDLFCDRLLDAVLQSKTTYESFIDWLNSVDITYRNKVIKNFLKTNPRLALEVFYTKRLSGDQFHIHHFLKNTWPTLPQHSDNIEALDKTFILRLLTSAATDGNTKAPGALSALIDYCPDFMSEFLNYLNRHSIGTLSAPDSYFFFLQRLNLIASEAFLNALITSNRKDILSVMMRPENLVECLSMSKPYNIIERYILETWPNLTMHASSSAASDIDQSFILSCLTAPDAYKDIKSATYVATLLKNLINAVPDFDNTIVSEFKRSHADLKQVLLKIVDQEASPMAKNVMCKKFILLLNEHEDKDTLLALIHKMDLNALLKPNTLSDDEIANTLNLIHPYLDATKKEEVINSFHYHETKRNYADHPIISEKFSWTWLIHMFELPRLQQQKDFKPSPILLHLIEKGDENHFFEQLIAIRKNASLRDLAKESSIENIYQWIKNHKTYSKHLANKSIRSQQYSLHQLSRQDGSAALDPNFLPIPIAQPQRSSGYFYPRVTAAVAVPVNEGISDKVLSVVEETPTAPPMDAMNLEPTATPVVEPSAPPLPAQRRGSSVLSYFYTGKKSSPQEKTDKGKDKDPKGPYTK